MAARVSHRWAHLREYGALGWETGGVQRGETSPVRGGGGAGRPWRAGKAACVTVAVVPGKETAQGWGWFTCSCSLNTCVVVCARAVGLSPIQTSMRALSSFFIPIVFSNSIFLFHLFLFFFFVFSSFLVFFIYFSFFPLIFTYVCGVDVYFF
jgi:hypothetical protein